MSQGMTAKRLRVVLLILIFLVLAAIVGGFIFAQQNLRGYAATISVLNADAQSGDKNIETLRKLETTLSEKQSAVASAHELVADNSTYADAAIGDISRIAAESGVAISSFEFIDTAPSTAAPSAAPTTAAPTQSAATAPAGVTKKTISVAVESPLKYSNLLNFIQGIETNKLKMQIATVTMTKDQDDMVGTQTFSIEVYVRQ